MGGSVQIGRIRIFPFRSSRPILLSELPSSEVLVCTSIWYSHPQAPVFVYTPAAHMCCVLYLPPNPHPVPHPCIVTFVSTAPAPANPPAIQSLEKPGLNVHLVLLDLETFCEQTDDPNGEEDG